MSNKYKLYTVSWSLHCITAERLLLNADIPFEKIDLNNWDLVAAAPRDLGIHRLPALEGNDVFFEGLSRIKKFVEDRQVIR